MITWSFLLLVGVLVLLIHDDQAERIDGRKNGRASANDDSSAALADFVPFIMALAGGQIAMQNRNERLQRAGGETGFEALDRLRRERDFRHENDSAFALLESVSDGL